MRSNNNGYLIAHSSPLGLRAIYDSNNVKNFLSLKWYLILNVIYKNYINSGYSRHSMRLLASAIINEQVGQQFKWNFLFMKVFRDI